MLGTKSDFLFCTLSNTMKWQILISGWLKLKIERARRLPSSHPSWWSLTSEFEDKNWQIPLTHLLENVVTTNQSERREQLHPTGQSLELYSLGIYLEITFSCLPNSMSAQEVPTKETKDSYRYNLSRISFSAGEALSKHAILGNLFYLCLVLSLSTHWGWRVMNWEMQCWTF